MKTKEQPPTPLSLEEIQAAFDRLTQEEQLALEDERVLTLRLNHAKAMAAAGKSGDNVQKLTKDLHAAQQRAAAAVAERESLEPLKIPARYHELKRNCDETNLREEADAERLRLMLRRLEKLQAEQEQLVKEYQPLKYRMEYSGSRISRVRSELANFVEQNREALTIAGVLTEEGAVT